MKLSPSTLDDIEQLTEWIKEDPYHNSILNPTWWITGNGILAYCIQDGKGPTMYVRTDKEGDLLRVHTQFAPETEVSKIRVIKSILFAMPKMIAFAKDSHLKGLIYRSTSPTLIQFMQRQFSFVPAGTEDDFIYTFGEDQE